ncbi:uncharacterized protein BKA78DRAFT_356900 [Phyllosticta capitalensis]|uniref:uncharacterized protein n=1 Tax=Phyllosticta capitalensis TaxID=121624 RepID=UPI003130E099
MSSAQTKAFALRSVTITTGLRPNAVSLPEQIMDELVNSLRVALEGAALTASFPSVRTAAPATTQQAHGNAVDVMNALDQLVNEQRVALDDDNADGNLQSLALMAGLPVIRKTAPATTQQVHGDAVDTMKELDTLVTEQRVTLQDDNSNQKFEGFLDNIYQGYVRSEADHLISMFHECATSPPPPQQQPAHATRSSNLDHINQLLGQTLPELDPDRIQDFHDFVIGAVNRDLKAERAKVDQLSNEQARKLAKIKQVMCPDDQPQ